MKFYRILFFLISSPFYPIHSKANIDTLWPLMQAEYNTMHASLAKNKYLLEQQKYCHPHWLSIKKQVRNVLLGNPDPKLLNHGFIGGSMVRTEMQNAQQYEVCFLNDCISSETKAILERIQDTDFFSLPRNCHTFNCSINTLGHLFYTAKILEKNKRQRISSIIEFGGGYGNLARILKKALPETTIFLIDLPEFLAIQFLFLKGTLPGTPIIMHTEKTNHYEPGAIHLIPVFILQDIELTADVFISTFALSESTEFTQNIVVNKNFFNASTCYITGQLDGWGTNFSFAHHTLLHNAIRTLYTHVECQPFHTILINNLKSYELIGQR